MYEEGHTACYGFGRMHQDGLYFIIPHGILCFDFRFLGVERQFY